METSRRLPGFARVVVIGGGVTGISTAYHLAAAGVTDVVLVERGALGSGSTGRAAGGVRTQFSDRANIEMAVRSLNTYRQFGERFGQDIDLRQTGYLFLLDSAATVSAFERNVALQNELGLPSRMISVAEAKRLTPLIDTDGLVAAAYSPTDGYCTPESVVLGFAGAARRHGARLLTHCAATGIDINADRIVGVRTEGGRIETDTVICAAGAWSRQIGEWTSTELAVTPLRRQLLVTEPMADLPPDLPFTIDFGTSFYLRNEGAGLLLGASDLGETPGYHLGPTEDWLSQISHAVQHRAPRLAESGVAHHWAGLYEMTPDHNALIGEADGPSRFLYAGGFSGHGFMMAPAVGEIMRDLFLGRPPFIDVSQFHARRFQHAAPHPELNIV
ncbi:NAD(P)/FAD-dependent oxidoreductase [Salinispora oceanensis]|uniref:NAD(P)/FAD-dependent oxidoreductase n=1 Tax=Salinispora oceanensis TaxID=1050199 RepID=UPI0003AA8079|nr:FAD-binding oxidoreductase [Salinispora oceanensis]